MTLKEILNKFRGKKEYYHQIKTEDQMQDKLVQSKLSSEERALNKILEKKRQESIKAELKEHYKNEDDDYWHKDVITQPNIFKGKDKLLNNQHNLFHNKNVIRQRRLFT